MMTTPTAALVEEAERQTTCAKCGAAIVEYGAEVGLRPTEDGLRSHTSLVCERTQALRRAEAERDAQHAEVLRLTGERDSAREGWQQEVIKGIARASTVCELADALDEARAQIATLELLHRGGK